MSEKGDLLATRFQLNMRRISGLTILAFSLEQPALLQSEGPQADIFRAIVVFLHATFEVLLKSQLRRPKKAKSYSGNDIDKTLQQVGIDPTPFKYLYRPLTGLAKKRHQIVHEADFVKSTDVVANQWGIVESWLLVMWQLAVLTFYYQLRISTKMATEVERAKYNDSRQALDNWSDIGHQFIAFAEAEPNLRKEALEKVIVSIENVHAIFKK